jgi:hypothetical protein
VSYLDDSAGVGCSEIIICVDIMRPIPALSVFGTIDTDISLLYSFRIDSSANRRKSNCNQHTYPFHDHVVLPNVDSLQLQNVDSKRMLDFENKSEGISTRYTARIDLPQFDGRVESDITFEQECKFYYGALEFVAGV